LLPRNAIAHRRRIEYLQLKTDNDMSASNDSLPAGGAYRRCKRRGMGACSTIVGKEAMLSGSAEPECRVDSPVMSPKVRGAERAIPRPAAIPTSAHDPPHPEATKIASRATIHPTVNGSATACRWAGSTAVN
jgi:hypothetical protein